MLRTKPLHRTALSGALLLALSAASCAAMGQDIRLADDLGERGFRILGAASDDISGFSVSGVGDVNGDGLADLVIGAPNADPNVNVSAGTSYVVFGQSDEQAEVNLNSLGDRGFTIFGAAASDRSGLSVSGAGDVNGDGLADLVIGAPFADPSGDDYAGTSYVVFGKADEQADITLNSLGDRGFKILGLAGGGRSGSSVSGAGDVNGDGLADLVIGVPYFGVSFVVFGKAGVQENVNLNSLGDRGFAILGALAVDGFGYSVSGAGDVNGDGLSDLIIGEPHADPTGINNAGTSYVVFGKAGVQENVNLNRRGERFFKIHGATADDHSGASVSGAGDVNGDGLADLVIGAHFAQANGVFRAGNRYVVFGKADVQENVRLDRLGDRGFTIVGVAARDGYGGSVSGVGDVNGDGLSDLVIGVPLASNRNAGTSYVVFGESGVRESVNLNLNSLGDRGFTILGAEGNDLFGRSVSGAGDVNGDGIADLVIGAPSGGVNAGTSYVVFGSTNLTSATYRTTQRPTPDCLTTGPFWTRVGIVGDGSNDDSPDARIDLSVCSPFEVPALAATVTLYRAAATASDGSPAQYVGPVRPAAVSWDVDWGYPGPASPMTLGVVDVHYTDEEIAGLDEGALQLYREIVENGVSRFEPVRREPVPRMVNEGVDEARNRFLAFVPIPVGIPLRLALGVPSTVDPRGDAVFIDDFED